jgi:cytochrome c peroxidase
MCLLPTSREWIFLALSCLLCACGNGSAPLANSSPAAAAGPSAAPVAAATSARPVFSPAALLGEKIFVDTTLSASGKMACVSCHDPHFNFAPPNDFIVQLGGPQLNRPGLRAVPSIKYKERTPSFFAEKGPESPVGGFDWDGRRLTMQAQPAFPLLAANEMANADAADVAAKLMKAPYAEDFKKVFGANIFNDPEMVMQKIGFALAIYQQQEPAFHPYDSKYDYYLRGKVSLSAQEQRGLKLFDDEHVGCAACHLDKIGEKTAAGALPVFTDYEFEALGVPRNPAIPANADPKFYDMGLCGPVRTDKIAAKTQYCGMFKTPTLRNVAMRKVFFHNGRFTTLKDMMHFYVERDTSPEKWYPKNPDGSIRKFDDLPPQYQDNIDTQDAPFDRKHGDKPALSDAEIDDVIAFLQTLNDGYQLPPQ